MLRQFMGFLVAKKHHVAFRQQVISLIQSTLSEGPGEQDLLILQIPRELRSYREIRAFYPPARLLLHPRRCLETSLQIETAS